MNERIQQLAEQAGARRDGWGRVDLDNFQYEKFAELIVKHCIGCCEQVISDPVPESVNTWFNGGEQCIQEIKQHFGVEND